MIAQSEIAGCEKDQASAAGCLIGLPQRADLSRRFLERRETMALVGALLGVVCLLTGGGCERRQDFIEEVAETANISLSRVDEQDYQRNLNRYNGRVILVDFWATWCGPCVEMFPATVAKAEKYGPGGLTVFSVSCDDEESFQDVRRFLAEAGADNLVNMISEYGAGTETMEKFELDGSVPTLKLYDRGGRLRYTFGMDHSQLEQRIEELLAEPEPGTLTPEEEERVNQLLGEDQ